MMHPKLPRKRVAEMRQHLGASDLVSKINAVSFVFQSFHTLKVSCCPFEISLTPSPGPHQSHLVLPWGVRVQRPNRPPTSIPAATGNTAVSSGQDSQKLPPKRAHIIDTLSTQNRAAVVSWASHSSLWVLVSSSDCSGLDETIFKGPFSSDSCLGSDQGETP